MFSISLSKSYQSNLKGGWEEKYLENDTLLSFILHFSHFCPFPFITSALLWWLQNRSDGTCRQHGVNPSTVCHQLCVTNCASATACHQLCVWSQLWVILGPTRTGWHNSHTHWRSVWFLSQPLTHADTNLYDLKSVNQQEQTCSTTRWRKEGLWLCIWKPCGGHGRNITFGGKLLVHYPPNLFIQKCFLAQKTAAKLSSAVCFFHHVLMKTHNRLQTLLKSMQY